MSWLRIAKSAFLPGSIDPIMLPQPSQSALPRVQRSTASSSRPYLDPMVVGIGLDIGDDFVRFDEIGTLHAAVSHHFYALEFEEVGVRTLTESGDAMSGHLIRSGKEGRGKFPFDRRPSP